MPTGFLSGLVFAQLYIMCIIGALEGLARDQRTPGFPEPRSILGWRTRPTRTGPPGAGTRPPNPGPPGRNSIGGTSLLFARPEERHRWPMDAVPAASMAHRCCSTLRRNRIDGPSMSFLAL